MLSCGNQWKLRAGPNTYRFCNGFVRNFRFPRVAVEALVVAAAYTGVAVWATWPLARQPLGGFYGFGNDNWGGIWIYDWLHEAYRVGKSPHFSRVLGTPFGFRIPDQGIQPIDRLTALLFGGLDQGLGAYNLQVFSSFVLAGITMYLLARYVTGSKMAAALGGFIFTYSPFHLAMAMQYQALASIQWIPLFVLALLHVLRTGRLRDSVWTGAAFALVAAGSYYYAWLTAWFTLFVVAAFFAREARMQRRRSGKLQWPEARRFLFLLLTRGGLAALVALALVGPLALPSITSLQSSEVVKAHPLTEAIRYSARPWMFFLPPHDNPVTGSLSKAWILTHLYDIPVYEQSAYLGYTAILLAGIALWRVRATPGFADRALFSRYLLLAGGAIGLVIMMGPYLPLDISYWRLYSQPELTRHLPSLGVLMFHLAPMFRFFSRAFVLVSVCLATLAAIGFARTALRLGRSMSRQSAFLVLAVVLVGLEYANAPPHVFLSDREPAWVSAVRKLPEAASIIDYPVASLNSPRSLYYIFWQRIHRHSTVNPPQGRKSSAFHAVVNSPDDPEVGRRLHEAGIDYAVVHTRLPPLTTPPYQPHLPDDSMPVEAGSRNPWFRRVLLTSDAVIYRILGAPRLGVASILDSDRGRAHNSGMMRKR